MVIGNSLFTSTEAEVNDSGYLSVAAGDNIANGCETTGDILEGTIFSMFDSSITTSCGSYGARAGAITRYITFDFGRRRNKVVCTTYYSIVHAGAINGTTTWQTSLDGTTWTDEDGITLNGAGETFKNWSETIQSLRYLRLKYETADAGATACGSRIYHLQCFIN